VIGKGGGCGDWQLKTVCENRNGTLAWLKGEMRVHNFVSKKRPQHTTAVFLPFIEAHMAVSKGEI
jgi:hypothetical protein